MEPRRFWGGRLFPLLLVGLLALLLLPPPPVKVVFIGLVVRWCCESQNGTLLECGSTSLLLPGEEGAVSAMLPLLLLLASARLPRRPPLGAGETAEEAKKLFLLFGECGLEAWWWCVWCPAESWALSTWLSNISATSDV